MFFTFWKPYVMFPLNFLALFLHLSLLWRYHLWYLLPLLPRLFFLWTYQDVICGTSYFYSLSCLSYGHLWYLLFLFPQLSVLWRCHMWYLLPLLTQLSLMWRCHSIVCQVAYIIVGTTYTIIGTANGSTLPFIIFYALTFVLSYFLFIPKLETSPSSTLFFLLKTLLGKSVVTFFLFSNIVHIFSLVLLTLVGGLCGFSF